jgi:U4/U6 small nuclear ribonucleoprotein PRP4
MDSHVRIWDIRVGRAIWSCLGHVKSVLDVQFNPRMPTVATASEDGTIKIWDLRKLAPIYNIPAHSSVVSSAKWDATGGVLISCGFDGFVKVWGAFDGGRLLSTLVGHENKVMSVDIVNDCIVSTGSDRTFKIWSNSDYYKMTQV